MPVGRGTRRTRIFERTSGCLEESLVQNHEAEIGDLVPDKMRKLARDHDAETKRATLSYERYQEPRLHNPPRLVQDEESAERVDL